MDEKTTGVSGLSLKSKDILKYAYLLLGMNKKRVIDTALLLYAEKFDLYGAAQRFANSRKNVDTLYENGSGQD